MRTDILTRQQLTPLYRCLVILSCALLLVACEVQTAKHPLGHIQNTESATDFVQKLSVAGQHMRSWRELTPTLQKSLSYVKAKNQKAFAIKRTGLVLTWEQLRQSLEELMEIIPKLDKNPELLLEHFKWVKMEQGIHFTGYYEPIVLASRTFKEGYFPIYKRPPELTLFRRKRIKFFSREAIDSQKMLANRGLELAWAKSLVDIFYMQIQGSGKLLFEDGSTAYINYAGQNGHKYTILGKTMREMGLISRGNVLEQRKWFLKNPTRIQEILNTNPSYVFFSPGKHGVRGAMGRILDPLRSLASDRKYIPLGAIVAYGLNMPHILTGKSPMRGLAFTQDVGGAIRGNRCDIFMGNGPIAEYRASLLHTHGLAWVLVSKKALETKEKKDNKEKNTTTKKTKE